MNKQAEMNNILERINSRIIGSEEQITDLEDRLVESKTRVLGKDAECHYWLMTEDKDVKLVRKA